ncbi:MAG TPA: serine hydrolase domain-containing protein [Spirochaetales bacterium]|nr:serine hydrolase domain-containing protein [Spirochaetales bacterium]
MEVKRRFTALRIIAAFGFAAATLCAGPAAAQARFADPRAAAIDAYLRSYAEAGTFMGSVLVAEGGKPLITGGYGLADLSGAANDARTRFRIGSISKSFTAAAVLKLQEEGKLSLDDSVARHLPGFPRGEAITIRQLLTHSSGIPDYLYLGDAYLELGEPGSLDALVATFSGEKPDFEPGQKFAYSNSGYVLCAKIIERASGRAYADYVEERILRPAGMSGSGLRYESLAALGGKAVGYHFTGEGYVPTPPWHSSKAAGAGAVCSSAEDLLAWSRSLLSGKVIGPASLAAMLEPTALSRKSYGMGWYRRPFLGRDRIYHGGYLFGFRSDLSIYPAEGLTIVLLSNVDTAPTRLMAEDLARIVFGEPWQAPSFKAATSIDASAYPRYAGTYDTSEVFGPGATMSVYAEGEALWYRSNTLYDSLALPIHIYPESPSSFFDKTGTARYEFIAGGDGKAEAIRISDGEDSFAFKRIR